MAERDADILAAFARGASQADVARRFGISPQRVSQIARRLQASGLVVEVSDVPGGVAVTSPDADQDVVRRRVEAALRLAKIETRPPTD